MDKPLFTLSQALDMAGQHVTEGRFAEGEAICREVLRVQPEQSEAVLTLGIIAFKVGRQEIAVDLVRRAIAMNPAAAHYHNTLGGVLQSLGRSEEAIASLRASVAAQPAYAEAWNNLGDALRSRRRWEESIAACRTAISLRPDFAEAHNNLANVLRDRGRLDEAIAEYRTTVALKSDYLVARNNLVAALLDHGDYEATIAELHTLLEMCPHYAEAHTNLGTVLQARQQSQAAIAEFRSALLLQPNDAVTHCNLGNSLKDQGKLGEAIECYRQATALTPDSAAIHSNIVYILQFLPDKNEREIREEQTLWNRRHAAPLQPLRQAHGNDRDPTRRIKLGYVSSDFRDHSVSFFLTPLLEAHDRQQVEAYCYSGIRKADAVTERLRKCVSVWREVPTYSDDELAAQIRADGIDILVDLTMHSANHRLLTFARKPAPVQVSWLAYPGTTGLETIDYRLTDAFMEPSGCGNDLSGGRPLRLPDSWCCYEPLGEFPEPGDLPALRAGHVTYGSLNNFCKINEAVQECWVRVLQATPDSRLLIYCQEGDGRRDLLAFFTARGVGAERVEFVAHCPREEHMRLYRRIDICLDPFPCNGMTTTCHALWMGSPVVTLPGSTPVSRAALSLLSTVGLLGCVARSQDDYIGIAMDFATDLPRLAEFRATARQRLRASPLMDAPRFARAIEGAYRAMWREWCGHTALPL